MTDMIPDILNDVEHQQVRYSTFWQRFFAIIIDGLVLSPFIFIDNYNKTDWKSNVLFAVSFLITLAYKPFLESMYGATVGKMAIGLRVVNSSHEKATLKNIVFRNIFDISGRLLTGAIAVITFANPGFDNVDSLAEYSSLSALVAGENWITAGLIGFTLIDSIVLIADSRRQALHDKIGQTFVIQK